MRLILVTSLIGHVDLPQVIALYKLLTTRRKQHQNLRTIMAGISRDDQDDLEMTLKYDEEESGSSTSDSKDGGQKFGILT